MRAMSLRSAIAIILGCVTPFWIIYGFELTSLMSINIPQTDLSWSEGIVAIQSSQFFILICVMALCFIFLVASTVKAISYNAIRRAANGFLSLLALNIIVLIIFDFTEYHLYAVLLAILTAFNISHYVNSRLRALPPYVYIMFPIIFILLSLWNFL